MKKTVFLLIFLLIVPQIWAEISESNLETLLDANRKQIQNDLQSRDKLTEDKINAKFDEFRAEIKHLISMLLFKIGLVMIGTVCLGGFFLLSVRIYTDKLFKKIQLNRAKEIRKQLMEVINNGKPKPEI